MKNLIALIYLYLCLSSVYAEDFNSCMRQAVIDKVPFNKVLTLCRDKIKPSSEVGTPKVKALEKSNYISTSKSDQIIHDLIQKGDLDKASDLAERLEIEKTKRIKARADAEALRAPQVITNTTTNKENSDINSNIRSSVQLGTNPILTGTAGTSIVTINTQGNHGAIAGQYVTLSYVDSLIDGIPASDFNKRHSISSILSTTSFTISVASNSQAGSVSGGGSSVIAVFEY